MALVETKTGGSVRCEVMTSQAHAIFGTSKYGDYTCALYAPGYGRGLDANGDIPSAGVVNSYLVQCHTVTTCSVTPGIPTNSPIETFNISPEAVAVPAAPITVRTTSLPATAPTSCSSGSGTPANELATPAVKARLRTAYLSTMPSVQPADVTGPILGKTYFGSLGECRYAVAMFSSTQTGTTDQPEMFDQSANDGPWIDRGDTAGGCIKTSVIRAPLLRLWRFTPSSSSCFTPPSSYFNITIPSTRSTAPPSVPTIPTSAAAIKAYSSGYTKCFGVSHGFYVSPDMHDESLMSNVEKAGCSDSISKRGNRLFAGLPDSEKRAIAKVEDQKGWQVGDVNHYGPLGKQLHAFTAVQKSGSSGTPSHVFFFYGDQYLGMDAPQPSEDISIISNDGSTVVVRYTVWAPNDAHCCASRSTRVRFHWTGTNLLALDPIPPVSSRY